MTYTTQKLLTIETFLAQYANNPCYELADVELVDFDLMIFCLVNLVENYLADLRSQQSPN